MLFTDFVATYEDLFGADDFWRVMKSDAVTCTTTGMLYGKYFDHTRLRSEKLKPVVVLTSADDSVTDERLMRYPEVQAWFAINNFSTKAVTIPYGLYLSNYSIYGDKLPIMRTLSKPKPDVLKLAYMNFSICTYPEERQAVFVQFSGMPWVTTEMHTCSVPARQQYLDQIYGHKFCFCPRGNGVDTVRMWESLFLQTIPVVRKSPALDSFQDLPILFIDNWEQVTPEFLETEYDRMSKLKWNMNKLTLRYWQKLVQDTANSITVTLSKPMPSTESDIMWAHVHTSFESATANESKLTKTTLHLPGYSGNKTRHFYNNICSAPWAKFLQVGNCRGAGIAAALFKNPHCKAFVIDTHDNWTDGLYSFQSACEELVDSDTTILQWDHLFSELLEQDFTVYLFDALHTYDAHKLAITHFWKNLQKSAIVIIDDWNWDYVRHGTMEGFKDVNAIIENFHEVLYTYTNEHTPWEVAKSEFWNGVGIFLVSK
jgi:hypothetical protein